jgi:hypothetical protein
MVREAYPSALTAATEALAVRQRPVDLSTYPPSDPHALRSNQRPSAPALPPAPATSSVTHARQSAGSSGGRSASTAGFSRSDVPPSESLPSRVQVWIRSGSSGVRYQHIRCETCRGDRGCPPSAGSNHGPGNTRSETDPRHWYPSHKLYLDAAGTEVNTGAAHAAAPLPPARRGVACGSGACSNPKADGARTRPSLGKNRHASWAPPLDRGLRRLDGGRSTGSEPRPRPQRRAWRWKDRALGLRRGARACRTEGCGCEMLARSRMW